MSQKVYKIVTDRIIGAIKTMGMLPWTKPWIDSGPTYNALTGHVYRGANIWITALTPHVHPGYVTWKQAMTMKLAELRKQGKEITEKVKSGTTKAGKPWTKTYYYADGEYIRPIQKDQAKLWTPIIFWRWIKVKVDDPENRDDVENSDDVEKTIPMLRYYQVYNVEQTTLDELPEMPERAKADGADHVHDADMIVNNWLSTGTAPTIAHDSDHAFYRPLSDEVHMPSMDMFKSTHGYYATLFHELGHATGHESRLNRDLSHRFGTKKYAREELVAEMTSAYMVNICGMDCSDQEKNTVAYIQSWIKALKNDDKLLVLAAARAQKATDLILGIDWSEKSEHDEYSDEIAA